MVVIQLAMSCTRLIAKGMMPLTPSLSSRQRVPLDVFLQHLYKISTSKESESMAKDSGVDYLSQLDSSDSGASDPDQVVLVVNPVCTQPYLTYRLQNELQDEVWAH